MSNGSAADMVTIVPSLAMVVAVLTSHIQDMSVEAEVSQSAVFDEVCIVPPYRKRSYSLSDMVRRALSIF